MRRRTRGQLAAPPSRLALPLAEHGARDRPPHRPSAPRPCPDPGTTPPGGAASSACARTPRQLQVPARPAPRSRPLERPGR
ncbi:hypothetical protein J1605_014592 [Eschrichtius robustus]|uniref:Uncharacterized protein n=1 Tax=Eschrichtius robustus TaxID=9764 RepID=A0AB34GBT8_ESCRO|nr:hypothetical protein J1605_014592 [Eschrichtius robustus]